MTKGFVSNYQAFFPKFSGINQVSDDAARVVLSFRLLPDGWHYGRGSAPKPETEVWALELIALFSEQGADAIEAFPDVDGGILVSAYHGGATVDALMLANKTVEWDADDCEFEKLALSDAIKKIRGLNWQTKSSGYCIHATTAIERNTSNRWRLRTPQMAAGHQLSVTSVSSPSVTVFARTFQDSTQLSEVTHLSSGNLIRQVSQVR